MRWDGENEDEEGDDAPREPSRAVPGGAETLKRQNPAQSSSEGAGGGGVSSEPEDQIQQYCTQRCLLGLTRGWTLDEACPNVLSHRRHTYGNQHPVGLADFARLVQEQLARDMDRDCEPLGKRGARGALFQLTLARYGYTFVGKGTLSRFVRHLRHEGDVYRWLEQLQGEVVPVYLGNIDLMPPYYLDGQDIVHMLLMSWAGDEAVKASVPDLAGEVRRTSQEVRAMGVVHGDEREPNMLWNTERRRVMLIDFDRASFLPVPKHKQLLKLSKKEKKRKTIGPGSVMCY